MADLSDSRVPPERVTVELALRVAQHEVNGREESYWRGAVAALLWVLGEVEVTPVSEEFVRVDLDEGRRVTVMREAEHAYRSMYRRRGRDEPDLRYLTGVENTLMWVVTGSGFAQTLDPEWLRDQLGVE